jgi:hypothetical protein
LLSGGSENQGPFLDWNTAQSGFRAASQTAQASLAAEHARAHLRDRLNLASQGCRQFIHREARPSRRPEIGLWSLEQKEPSMFKFGVASIAQKRMAASMIFAGLSCGAALLPMLNAAGAALQDGSVPMLSSTEFGWLADTEFLPPPSGPGPVTFDKAHPYIRNNTTGQPTFRISDVTNPILQPWVVERMRHDNDEVLAGKFAFTARSSCWPAGVPGFMVFGCGGRTVYFIQTPKEVTIINEGDQQVRHVYMNVPHSARPEPSWYGESVGHYEGDELVVDTIGLNDKSFVDNYRTPHTERLHVVERFKLIEGGKTLQVLIEVEDPGAFTMKWQAVQRFKRWLAGPMAPSACSENNFDFFTYKVEPIPRADRPDF